MIEYSIVLRYFLTKERFKISRISPIIWHSCAIHCNSLQFVTFKTTWNPFWILVFFLFLFLNSLKPFTFLSHSLAIFQDYWRFFGTPPIKKSMEFNRIDVIGLVTLSHDIAAASNSTMGYLPNSFSVYVIVHLLYSNLKAKPS